MRLTLLGDPLLVAKLPPDREIANPSESTFWSLTRTADEVSLVCEERFAPKGASVEGGWRCFRVDGPLGFSLVGVIAGISTVLAQAGVSIFVVSTYETDYVLVKEENVERATEVLRAHGYEIG